MKLRYLAVAGIAVSIVSAVTVARAAGLWSTLPIIGGSSYCASTVTGATGQICGLTEPAGPPALVGTEVMPLDLLAPGTQSAGPQTSALLPLTSLANGYGTTTIATTTGTTASVVVANGVSNYIYAGAGAATYTAISLPPNPIQNQKFCLTDAGSGILTLTAVNVGTTGQSIVGTAPTSIPVATAVGTAGTVTLSSNCWLYNVSNTTWYRVL